MTKEQAQLICEAHDIIALLEDDEEAALLRKHNPKLLAAYCALRNFAYQE